MTNYMLFTPIRSGNKEGYCRLDPFPSVVLVHGSGSLDRDGDVFGHKSFLVLADRLARQGTAVLRYEKRGVAKSSGSLKRATTFDLADAAELAVGFLRGRAEVDARKIGIVGHSEGGLAALSALMGATYRRGLLASV